MRREKEKRQERQIGRNREKSIRKEETRQSDSDGVRRERKSKGNRRSERAIRVMHCARERLFSNIYIYIFFFKTTYRK